MLQEHQFARTEVLPSWFENALQSLLSVAAFGFQIVQLDNTHIEVPASADEGAAVLSVGGKWRWIEATLTYAHPGGAAGNYPIFATCVDNNIVNTPQAYTDDTNYAFALQILAPGATPNIVAGIVDFYRQVGVAVWDGTKITQIQQTAPLTGTHANQHATGGTDPITPAAIGAAAVAALTAETNRAEAAEAAEVAAREAAINAVNTALSAATENITDAQIAAANKDGASNKPSLRTLGTGASQAAAGNDPRFPPVGAQLPYAGLGDALPGTWVAADGRLLDSTVYTVFDEIAGHAAGDPYNGGVNPGVNGSGHQQCKLPDKRGRKPVGAINMGTGAGSNDNAHVQASRGAHGGEVNHTLASSEMPVHAHGVSDPGHVHNVGNLSGSQHGVGEWQSGEGNWQAPGVGNLNTDLHTTGLGIYSAGSGGSHNNTDPYEADGWIVRIA